MKPLLTLGGTQVHYMGLPTFLLDLWPDEAHVIVHATAESELRHHAVRSTCACPHHPQADITTKLIALILEAKAESEAWCPTPKPGTTRQLILSKLAANLLVPTSGCDAWFISK